MDFDYGTWVADNGLQPIEKLSPRVKRNLKRGATAGAIVGSAALAGKAGSNHGKATANRAHRIDQLGAEAQGIAATVGRKKAAMEAAHSGPKRMVNGVADDKPMRSAQTSHAKWQGRLNEKLTERERLQQKPGLRGHARMAAGKKP